MPPLCLKMRARLTLSWVLNGGPQLPPSSPQFPHHRQLISSRVFMFLLLKHGLPRETVSMLIPYLYVGSRFLSSIPWEMHGLWGVCACLMKLCARTLLTSLTRLRSLACDNFQHDQVSKISSERSGTPKKRKAPPPPISPAQVNTSQPGELAPAEAPSCSVCRQKECFRVEPSAHMGDFSVQIVIWRI